MIIKRYKIIRFLKRILIAIVICFLIYFVIKVLDKIMFKNDNKVLTEQEQRIIQYNTPAYGDLEIKEEQAPKFNQLINDYVSFCNNKEYDKAYALVDDDAKNKFFPTVEDFRKDVDEKFNKLKIYEYKNIVNYNDMYAYKFILYNDIMSYGSNWNSVEDERKEYILIVKDNANGIKLNINSYIRDDKTSNLANINNIRVEIVNKEIYYDYVNIKVKIKNNSQDIFVFNTKNTYYVTNGGNNVIEYEIKNLPLTQNYLFVQPDCEKEFVFKFDKLYAASFSDYSFAINEAYLVSIINNIDIVSNTLSISEINSLATNKFNIIIGL